MKHINIPIPEPLVEALTVAIKQIDLPCPKHKEHRKRLVALDECQHGLLRAIEKIEFGEIRITVEEGRPTHLFVTQSLKFGKEDEVEKMAWFIEGEKEPESKIIPFERHSS